MEIPERDEQVGRSGLLSIRAECLTSCLCDRFGKLTEALDGDYRARCLTCCDAVTSCQRLVRCSLLEHGVESVVEQLLPNKGHVNDDVTLDQWMRLLACEAG